MLNLNESVNKSEKHTETISTSIAIYEYLYGDIPSRISYHIIIFLIVAVGSFLSLTIVAYEHFGADPMKRTIINRLYSLIFSNLFITFWIWWTLRVLRDVFGLMPSDQLTWVMCIVQSVGLSSVLFSTELTVFRFLYIVVWRGVKPINDEFWAKFLAPATYFVALYSCIIAHFCGSGSPFDQGQIIDIKDKENIDR